MVCRPPSLDESLRLGLVTGRLAETSVREVARELVEKHSIQVDVIVLPITVAALMTPKWLVRKLPSESNHTHLVIPGYCESSLDTMATKQSKQTWRQQIETVVSAKVVCGPKDIRDLEAWLTGKQTPIDLTSHSIEIIAEINHAPRMSVSEVVRTAESLLADGADRIDLGCDPAVRCTGIAEYVDAIVQTGAKLSIDTFDTWEAEQAVKAGATLVLSVNSSNREAATQWGCEVVAISDTPHDLHSLDETVQWLEDHQVPFRIDPILEPIGAGLMASLIRYSDTRRRYPDHAMMMGIGNLTELTDADSAAINLLLLGICQELRIESVLTTQVINWARSSVKECDIARRLVHYSLANGVPPKRVSDALVMLRDPKLRPYSEETIAKMAETIRDNNYRLLAQDQQLILLSAGLRLQSDDPFELFAQLLAQPQSDNVDASHAFYLGYEMAKATIALQLGKEYRQDNALRWGHLTIEEDLHRLDRTSRHRDPSDSANPAEFEAE